MKKVVNGKLYDTNAATTVCSWRESAMMFGIDIEAEFTLFREKVAEKPMEGLKLGSWGGVSDWGVKRDDSKGEFFLAVQLVSGTGYGKGRIKPLGIDEARQIFEERADLDYCLEDTYEKYFGIRPQKPFLEELKEAFKAGAEAKKKQYEEEEARKKAEAEKEDKPF